MKKEELKNKNLSDLTAEELSYLYIDLGMSQLEITKFFGLTSNKRTQNLIKKYGLKKSKESVVQKRQETNLKKYGVACSLTTKESHEASAKSLRNSDTQEKRKQTLKNKYGVTSFFQNEDTREKAMQSIQNKFGTDNVSKVKTISEKAQKTREKNNSEKYGVSNQFQRKSIQEKRSDTLIRKYGTDKPMEIPVSKKKKILAMYEKTNLDPKFYEILNNKEKFIEYASSFDTPQTINELSHTIGVSSSRIAQLVREYECKEVINYSPNRSQYENEIIEYLETLGVKNIEKNNRTILNGKELDIYVPNKKIAIEFNGDYWHSTACLSDHKHHYNKSIECEKKGIRLIHIYEYEWLNKKDLIKSLLSIAFGAVNVKVYARNCTISKVTNEEAEVFNNANHLQGHRRALITYGLYYEGKLMQLMSFSHNKKYEWEIIRGCPGSNNIVIGGVSKLLSHFIRENNPKQIFSYCDFNKFDGTSYEKAGMKFIGYTGPDKKIIVNGTVMNRKPSKYKEYKKITEAEIYGSGSKKYLLEVKIK